MGDDRREPVVSEEAFEILFDGMTLALDLDVARSLGGAIEWEFTDAQPWHIIVTNGHAEAKPGKAGEGAALRLESSAADWAKIAAGRVDPRWALLKRRLRVHGSLAAKAKLPKLFR
jgi:putative sterol carrier protein